MFRRSFVCSCWRRAPAFAGEVDITWDPDADFSSYKTYAWQETTEPLSPQGKAWFIGDVDKLLAKKGCAASRAKPTSISTSSVGPPPAVAQRVDITIRPTGTPASSTPTRECRPRGR